MTRQTRGHKPPCALLQLFALCGVLLSACTEAPQEQLLYRVEPRSEAALVSAQGELEAAVSTAIVAPVSGPPKFIAWLAPEFSRVRKGEVIVRFGGEQMRTERRWTEDDLALSQEDLREKRGAVTTEQSAVLKDMQQVSAEKQFAEKFATDDQRLKSRLEILDDQLDTRFLGAKLEFLDWQRKRFSETAEREIDVLAVQETKHTEKLARLDEGLSALEITAPHDGLLTYEANWRGEKPQPGKQVWPGHKVANLPDVHTMQARLYVSDRDARGLSKGQPVTLRLTTMPDHQFAASVKSVSPAPSNIEKGNPQKFYEIVAELEQQQPELYKLGRAVRAQIQVRPAEPRIEIPLQSLFQDDRGTFVYRYQNTQFERQPVTTGAATPDHIEILHGLAKGDRVALFPVTPAQVPDSNGSTP
ncbi:HlyD family efflux transporter periplasmic adaptor subunit [Microbulbifer bruguierae]|uniref:HlyD family efflux transporter periplasmic adaptor subunit n=1 Tax=Microbulbifer bruguierae TaxID=3029061 RepID=A0ABY8NBM2_9GAMM|nr:HlyD family efflux transporter periplasmic adaptor subunit [Microbulbifer bruguierae]WGL16313.1 HlyD family efflux transporter periplasmic adaptor subunit [Microbulbifer bruguierae]